MLTVKQTSERRSGAAAAAADRHTELSAAARLPDPVRVESPYVASSARRRGRSRSTLVTLLSAGGIAALLVLLLGLAYSGSTRQLADGTQISGVDVGGLAQGEAVAVLEARFAKRAAEPVVFRAGRQSFSLAANQLAVRPDWSGAVAAAARAGDGFGPIRGFRRLRTRFFGAEVLPRIAVSNAALEFALDRIETRVDRKPVSAALARRGLRVRMVPERDGQRLDREAAAEVVVRALASLERRGAAALPIAVAAPRVTAPMLAEPARRARLALSRPVVLRGLGRSWTLSRARIAKLLVLPRDGRTTLAFTGPAAAAYFEALDRLVGKPPRSATFDVSGDSVRVVPSRHGTTLDVPRSARALLRAATSPVDRRARLVIVRAAPGRTTDEALAMGIDRRLSSYKTYNAGTADRITNLRRGVELLDGTLVPPGGTFSLNQAIGERTVERGFRPAPVIIGTEYEEEVGGGTSQVATTVFNAAWEAGLRITERNPHSLYISRYQLGRDATVYWPSLDLKFQNDTRRWVLVKGTTEWDGIRVSLYGGESRRVESSPGSFEITGRAPVERIEDPELLVGRTVVESSGSAPSRTSVTRTIYAADGSLLRTETWNTAYKGETRVVRVGTKEKPPPKKPKQSPAEAEEPPVPPGGVARPPPTRP
jgi:vancomycin resistance protein YoaR